MRSAMRRQFTAGHIWEQAAGAGDARRAGKRNASIGRAARMLSHQVAARPGSWQTIRAGMDPAVQRRGVV